MNSYNENLHSAIVNSLQSLDIEEQDLNSQVNAAMFTLYHAEGATIAAEQNLAAATGAYKSKTATQNQAIKDNNVLVNLLGTATQANQFVKQSTTNIAVSASNVQIATNAIVRLAGDMGSIYSILNAADFDSSIYMLAKEASKLINETAYDAEVTSQTAMEASTLTAEVSASTVLDMAKATNGLMSSVLKITTADFNTATQNIVTDSNAMAAVRSTEKMDEGALEMINISYNATKSAYALTNKELNLNLNVETSTDNPLSFTVNFDLIESPFPSDKTDENPMYPVEKYYIMVVKDAQKQTFSISNAENILLLGNSEIITVDPVSTSPVSQTVDVYYNIKDGDKPPVTDSDNKPIELGENYVVFVMAIFTDDYKRKTNCYDDYLSAPSQVFTLTTALQPVTGKTIKVVAYDDKKLTDNERRLALAVKNDQLKNSIGNADDHATVDFTHVMTFEMDENPNRKVEYRCMFLPASANASDRLLTVESLNFLVKSELPLLEDITIALDPVIAGLEEENYTNELKIGLLETELNELNEQFTATAKKDAPVSDEDAEKQKLLATNQKTLTAQLKELQKSHDANVKQFHTLTAQKDKMTQSIAEETVAKPGFLFNLPIAEQVYADSYIVARKDKDKTTANTAAWITFIGPDATDNFGNRLIEGDQYLPVVLSYSTAAAENESDFVNALSEMDKTEYFKY
ncbi:hypothetical protein [Pedobacter jeongneungensis]|uniref:hypothetical protein n=1 Tax=Pedobacter jeongneungensis TaxID=947309 RepID=UPI00046A203E|nr:hypothetical protein [Pedobacter jeongneungensis]